MTTKLDKSELQRTVLALITAYHENDVEGVRALLSDRSERELLGILDSLLHLFTMVTDGTFVPKMREVLGPLF